MARYTGRPTAPFRESDGQPAERPRRPRKPDYTTSQGMASAVLAGAMADPRGGSEWWTAGDNGDERRLLVPALPPAAAYTDMGRDVVPPRTTAMRPLPAGAKTAMTTADGKKRVESSAGLRVRYGQQHVLHPWSMRYLEATTETSSSHHLPHCLAALTRRRYAAKRAGEPLWWFVLVHTDGDLPIKSAFVRLAMRRRVQRAFREALRRRGYDDKGSPTAGAAGGQALSLSLSGTVRIEGMVRALLRTAFEPLVTHLERVVGSLEGVLGGRRGYQGMDSGHGGNRGNGGFNGGYSRNSRNNSNNSNNSNPVIRNTARQPHS